MPWEYKTVRAQREEFVVAARQSGETLDDRSRKPRRVSSRTPEAIESKILAVRAEHPGWGARKIKIVLERAGEVGIPSARTVGAVLRRHGCIDPEESRKRRAFQRFEREQCNELWQTDFKGEFRTPDGRCCYPLDIIDDHSRFVLRIAAFASTAQAVIPVFELAFREYTGCRKRCCPTTGRSLRGSVTGIRALRTG